jgi:hypothetical protein
MSGRTTAMTLNFGSATTVYGNWKNGSGTTLTSATTTTFSGGGTQTITSVGKTFTCPIAVDTYGGTVQLADALNISSNTLTVTNGTFTTAGFAVTANTLLSNSSNVRTINLGASTLTLLTSNFVNFATSSTNLTFNAGTSQINGTGSGSITFSGGGQTFYNVTFTSTGSSNTFGINGANTFNNLTITAPASTAIASLSLSANQIFNGTLTCAGASAVRRVFLQSNTIGTQRTLTVNSLSANDCDFREIIIAGAAAGTAPTRAGDCGNNSGITFPAPKTVYWNLAGTQDWSSTGWCTDSGGTPAVNNFPLAQDTAVFDNTGAVGTMTIERAWNIGTFDASARTSAMTFTTGSFQPLVYGNWLFGTGVTSSSSSTSITFAKNGTQTITSNGVQFGCPIIVDNPNAYVQLAGALSLLSTRSLIPSTGTFDAVTYNVTIGSFQNGTVSATRMGSGTWTLSGSGGTVWSQSATATLFAGTSTIVLSDTSTSARTFAGGGAYYNKLTIGGATGISTLTVNGNNTFGEFASTKTVAHTINFGATFQGFGKWSVTGTVGNVVTISSGTANNNIWGPAVSGVDYLAFGTSGFGINTTSPGEFYAGANSTGTTSGSMFLTAAPTPRTLYWVGGTGNWSSTTKWSTSSGGGSGAAIPTSLDAVIFNSASNATAYTATFDLGVTIVRCASINIAGPAAGNVTIAGSTTSAFHGNVTYAATGITRTYTGAISLVGNSSFTLITNGQTITSNNIVVSGIGATWTLGSALTTVVSFSHQFGTFSTSASNYAFSASTTFSSVSTNLRTLDLNASTLNFSGTSPISITATNYTLNAGTSQINLSSASPLFAGGGLTYYNVEFGSTSKSTPSITGANTFNNLTITGRTTIGIAQLSISANQTINGTLTVSAGTASAYRTMIASDTIGTTRTLTCAAVSLTDTDFRDITIAGAASPASGTRLGDCKGNSGITFDAAKTVYYRQPGSSIWGTSGAGSWTFTSGGAADATAFPLAQDTAVFPAAAPPSGATTTINFNYNIGTIDMSLRTSNTMTLATGPTTPQIYGNWVNGTGITLSGTGTITFSGRTTQQITSSARTFTQPIQINTPSGSVTLQDAFITSAAFTSLALSYGTFNANNYNVTLSGSFATFDFSNSNIRTVAFGSGTWAIDGGWTAATSTNLTVTGSATITMTGTTTHTCDGGGFSYSGITLNQGSSGTLRILNNKTFASITNTYGSATAFDLQNYTQTVGAWTAKGTAGNLLTIAGLSSSSIATLIYTGGGVISGVDYVVPTFVRVYPTTSTWYAGANSTNGGSLGWIFAAYVPPSGAGNGNFLVFF